MSTLFEIAGKIGLKGVEETKKELADVTNTAEKSSSKLGGFLSKVGKGIGTTAKVMGAGIGVAATAIGGLTVKAVSMGGELEQNMGGSEAVFGKYAGKMQDTAKKAFSNMGLSTSDYLATANKMGALFQGAGFDIEKSMTLSQGAMQRAADVASIMGIDTSAAMEAVAGAAKGNFTMMDNLGVAMNETTLANYALEKGMKKSYKEMTQQEKIGVAMEMFMDKTAYAAGNYAKENETLAGSLGTAKAALTNFLSGAGTVEDVVSSFTNAAEVIVKNVQGLFPKLMTGLLQIVTKLVPQIPPLLQELLPPLIEGAVGLVNGIVNAMPQIISAIMAAIPALINGITQLMNAIIQALPQLMQMIVSALPTLIPALITGLVTMIVTLCNQFSQIIQPIIDYLPDIIISIVEALMNNLPALIQGIIALVLGIVDAIPQIIAGLIEAIPQIISMVIEGLLGAIPEIISGLIQVIGRIVSNLPQILASLIKGFVETFKAIWEQIKNVFSPLGGWFGNKFKEGKENATKAWSGVKNFFSNIWNGVKNTASNAVNRIKSTFSNAWSNIKTKTSNVWNGIKTAITNPIQQAKEKVLGWINNIKNAFTNFKAKIKMPHITIKNASWNPKDWIQNGIPKFSVDWYKEGGILKQPTVFDYNPTTNTARVGGEAGAEAVAPIDTLMGYVQSAVSQETSGLAYHIQRIYDILANFLPIMAEGMNGQIVLDSGALVGQLAPKMDQKLGERYARKSRY